MNGDILTDLSYGELMRAHVQETRAHDRYLQA